MSGGGVIARRLLLSMGAILILILVLVRFGRPETMAEPLPVLGDVPAFALTDQRGHSVSEAELGGRPWVASFIFTRCGLSCPRMVSAMKRVKAGAPEDLQVVAITVDPDYDTVEVLADYAAANQVEWPGWLFLTGAKEDVRTLSIQGFKLGLDDSDAAASASPDEPIVHSTRLVLVDSQLRIRGYYDPFEPGGVESIVGDLARLEPDA